MSPPTEGQMPYIMKVLNSGVKMTRLPQDGLRISYAAEIAEWMSVPEEERQKRIVAIANSIQNLVARVPPVRSTPKGPMFTLDFDENNRFSATFLAVYLTLADAKGYGPTALSIEDVIMVLARQQQLWLTIHDRHTMAHQHTHEEAEVVAPDAPEPPRAVLGPAPPAPPAPPSA